MLKHCHIKADFPIATDLCDAVQISAKAVLLWRLNLVLMQERTHNTWTVADDCGNTSGLYSNHSIQIHSLRGQPLLLQT
jgi:hypothetical protein